MAYATSHVGDLLPANALSPYGLYTTLFMPAMEELLPAAAVHSIDVSPLSTSAAFV
jgi:hypothetical protein